METGSGLHEPPLRSFFKPNVVSVPHGWAEANCNILLDAKLLDHVSGYITMNSVACRIVKLA